MIRNPIPGPTLCQVNNHETAAEQWLVNHFNPYSVGEGDVARDYVPREHVIRLLAEYKKASPESEPTDPNMAAIEKARRLGSFSWPTVERGQSPGADFPNDWPDAKATREEITAWIHRNVAKCFNCQEVIWRGNDSHLNGCPDLAEREKAPLAAERVTQAQMGWIDGFLGEHCTACDDHDYKDCRKCETMRGQLIKWLAVAQSLALRQEKK